MVCALCLDKEATKKNTHYLTDGIIRSCLNLEGSNEREKVFYFDMSTKTAGIDFNFRPTFYGLQQLGEIEFLSSRKLAQLKN